MYRLKLWLLDADVVIKFLEIDVFDSTMKKRRGGLILLLRMNYSMS